MEEGCGAKGQAAFRLCSTRGCWWAIHVCSYGILERDWKEKTAREPVAKQYIFNHTDPLLPLLHIKLWACTSVAKLKAKVIVPEAEVQLL
jgi:hypothetical protein